MPNLTSDNDHFQRTRDKFASVISGRTLMRDYRLFSHDPATVVMHMDDFEAGSDDEAVKIARSMKKKVNCELWSLDRLVARIPSHK